MRRKPRIDQCISTFVALNNDRIELALNSALEGLALDIDQAEHLIKRGWCVSCRAQLTIESNFLACATCGKVSWRIALPASELAMVEGFVQTQSARAKRFAREQVIKQTENRHTEKQVRLLAEVQDHRCYYCAEHLSLPSKQNTWHKDHFHPLTRGGTDAINNIVLACPACNLAKGGSDGATWVRKCKKTMQTDALKEITAMHKRVKTFHRLALSHFQSKRTESAQQN